MAAIFKYFVGAAITLFVVVALSAITISELFVDFPALAKAPATMTPRWNIERLKAEPDTEYIAKGSLTPIYPATPGKELLINPVYTAGVKRIYVRQALQLYKLPRQLYVGGEEDRNYPKQNFSYAETRSSQLRTRIIFGHGLY
jgi:hypothetical protein